MRVKVLLTGVVVCLAASACSSGSDEGSGNQDPGLVPNQNGVPTAGTAGSNVVAGNQGTAGTPTAGAPVATAGAEAMAGNPAPMAGAGGTVDVPVAGGPTPVDTNLPPGCQAEYPDPRGACNLDTGFPGDDACILAPDASEGMQIHIGPTDYSDPAALQPFIFPAGSESSECWVFHTPNDQEIYYQGWVLSGRQGTHHIINTMYQSDKADGGFVVCRDGGTGTNPDSIGNLPGASKAYMPRGAVAPENANLGRSVPPHTSAEADMHYFNYTQGDLMREFWMNLYYIPKEQVTEEANQIRGMGGLSWTVLPIAPGTDNVYQYECPINAPGRIINLLGHYHSHGVRFTANLRRASGERLKVFEMYDYLEPAIFQYDTCAQNPPFSDSSPGAMTGMLEVNAGDVLEWECHIINDSQSSLRYTNIVDTGEMCNLWGASVGPLIDCVIF